MKSSSFINILELYRDKPWSLKKKLFNKYLRWNIL